MDGLCDLRVTSSRQRFLNRNAGRVQSRANSKFRFKLRTVPTEISCGARCHAQCHLVVPRKRKALLMTDTELRLIASAAMIGDSSCPVNGYRSPAANGIPSVL